MSFDGYKNNVETGDTVILFLGYDSMLQITVDPTKTYQTKYGALPHKSLIGKEYGSKVHCSKGWLYILHPTPELWTVNLPHRTQILYSPDISLIALELDLKPGSVVVESGTGSASLSHALLRTISPTGHLHTFDFHEQRADKARVEFEQHKVGHLVTVKHRDVCQEGFALENVADAVFLDLPSPWDALVHAKQAIKEQGGRICSFSPCIEQVQRSCERMRELGMTEISTKECLIRTLDVRTTSMPIADLGDGEFVPTEPIGKSGSHYIPTVGCVVKPRTAEPEDGPPDAKKLKKGKFNKGKNGGADKIHNKPSYLFKSASPPGVMPGHTGYLTFATVGCKTV